MLYVLVVGVNEDSPDLKVFSKVSDAKEHYREGDDGGRRCRLYRASTSDVHEAKRLVESGNAHLVDDSWEDFELWLCTVML